MSDQNERARAFAALHVASDPLILFNVWDAGGAKVVAGTGAKAIATGSWSVAAANGYEDGEQLPVEIALANLERIVAAVELPVTIDLERGYGESPDAVAETARRAWTAGAVGCNLEDGASQGHLRGVVDQSARLAAVRAAAPNLFINARTDLFLASTPSAHAGSVEEAIVRGQAYAAAGASGLFVPGLADERLIEQICAAVPLPVNVMVGHATPPAVRLAALGVARISYAGGPWRIAMDALREAAAAALS